MMSSDPDQSTFVDLLEPHRRELQAHCYRMVGTIKDAEDLVQETFVKALTRRDTLKARASVRAWLYKIATNTCLDFLRYQRRRYTPLTRESSSQAEAPIPDSIYEPIWLEPYPDELLDPHGNPETLHAQRESIRMAFIALLHRLPARQRAVVILQDVVGWSAKEIAEGLDTTVLAVKSALHRARATLAAAPHSPDDATVNEDIQRKIDLYMQAWESGDVSGLIALLTDDATFSMPPIPSWYQGKETIRALVTRTIFAGEAQGRWRLLPARANGQIAFAVYRAGAQPGTHHAYGIQLISARGGAFCDIITFRTPNLFAHFRLAETLPTCDQSSSQHSTKN